VKEQLIKPKKESAVKKLKTREEVIAKESFGADINLKEVLESKEYQKLKKEIYNSISDIIDQGIKDISIMPLFNVLSRLIKERVANVEIPEYVVEKVFWEDVADALERKGVFEDLVVNIMPLVEDREYGEVKAIINLKISSIIKNLNPTDKEFGQAILKGKFYNFLDRKFPEIKSLIMYSEEIPKERVVSGKEGRFSKGQKRWFEKPPEKKEGDEFKKEGKKHKFLPNERYLVSSRSWEVPDIEEIKPGLVIKCKNVLFNFEYKKFEVVDFPKINENDGEYYVDVIFREGKFNKKQKIRLADYGVISYTNGWWNALNRPIKWYQKRKSHS